MAGRAGYDRRAQQSSMAGLLSWDQPDTGNKDLRSANAWANGSDQNCGNFLTDRPTTRLHAAPGGNSQMASMLAWDTSADDSRPQQSPKRSPLKAPQRETGAIGAGAYSAVGGQEVAPPRSPSRAGQGYQVPSPFEHQARGQPAEELFGGKGGGPYRDMPPAGYGGKGSPDMPPAGYGGKGSPDMPPAGYGGKGSPMDAGPQHFDGRHFAPEQQQGGYAQPPFAVGGSLGRDAPGPAASPAGARHQSSSNAFACGHNQNSGNMITDRRITKINAPPGGYSSISFG